MSANVTRGAALGAYRLGSITLTDGMTASLPLDASGNLIISNIAGLATGKALLSVTGSASATFTLVAAHATNKIKVLSLDLITASATAVIVTFKSGAAGTALATYPLQALANTNFGITKTITPPGWLFATAAATLLEMSFSAAQTVTYNVTYHVDDLA